MKRYLYIIIAVFVCAATYAKEEGRHINDPVGVKRIYFNYETRAFDSGIVSALKVNDWVQLVVTNIPEAKDSMVFQAEVEFGNGHLEMGDRFGTYINPKSATAESEDVPKKANQEQVKEQVEKAYEEAKGEVLREMEEAEPMSKQVESLNTYNALLKIKAGDDWVGKTKINNITDLYKKFKLNSSTIKRDLEIGVAENFIRKYAQFPGAKAAMDDIAWQKYLVDIHQKNMVATEMVVDSITKVYAAKVDSLLAHSKTSNGAYYFMPFKVQNFDNTSINVQFLNKETLTPQNLIIPYINKSGFKLDFSTGFVFNTIYDKEYVIVNAANDHVQIRDKNEELHFNTGLALMAHAYRRSGKFFNWGGTTGISYNLNVQNLNYLLGLSALFGQEQRFILTAGAMMGKSKILASQYKMNTDIPQSELTIQSAVPLVDRLKISPFLGITYNLGLTTKTKKIKL